MKVVEAMFWIVYTAVFIIGILKTSGAQDKHFLQGHIALMIVVGMLAAVVYIHR